VIENGRFDIEVREQMNPTVDMVYSVDHLSAGGDGKSKL